MKIPLSCPHAVYKDGMRIFCTKVNNWCGNQYFKRCKGWWVLNDRVALCPVKKSDQKGD